jgi:hypothetical protein
VTLARLCRASIFVVAVAVIAVWDHRFPGIVSAFVLVAGITMLIAKVLLTRRSRRLTS